MGSIIQIKQKGNFDKLEKTLEYYKTDKSILPILKKYGERGVEKLSKATPVATGKTANSWTYDIIVENGRYTIEFDNSNIVDGVSIAIILQYGHGTRNGGYVAGKDYINPAMQQIFEEMAEELWREVVRA